MRQIRYARIGLGFTLLETLICTMIGAIMCIAAIQSIFIILQAEIKIRHKFQLQFAKLIAKHYLSSELYAANIGVSSCIARKELCDFIPIGINKLIQAKRIKPGSSILVIHSFESDIIYYLRQSVIPNVSDLPIYALYRDDILHNAQALIEGIIDFKVQIIPLTETSYRIVINIVFANMETQEIICVLNLP